MSHQNAVKSAVQNAQQFKQQHHTAVKIAGRIVVAVLKALAKGG